MANYPTEEYWTTAGLKKAARADDRRVAANSESRSDAFSGGFHAQREFQAKREANRDDNISRGKTLDYERKWGKPDPRGYQGYMNGERSK